MGLASPVWQPQAARARSGEDYTCCLHYGFFFLRCQFTLTCYAVKSQLAHELRDKTKRNKLSSKYIF